MTLHDAPTARHPVLHTPRHSSTWSIALLTGLLCFALGVLLTRPSAPRIVAPIADVPAPSAIAGPLAIVEPARARTSTPAVDPAPAARPQPAVAREPSAPAAAYALPPEIQAALDKGRYDLAATALARGHPGDAQGDALIRERWLTALRRTATGPIAKQRTELTRFLARWPGDTDGRALAARLDQRIRGETTRLRAALAAVHLDADVRLDPRRQRFDIAATWRIDGREMLLAFKADSTRASVGAIAELMAGVAVATEASALDTGDVIVSVPNRPTGFRFPTACAREFARLVRTEPARAVAKMTCISRTGT